MPIAPTGCARRRAGGLIGSIVGLLGLELHMPDHTTLNRRAATLEVPRPRRPAGDAGSVHLSVDSTELVQILVTFWP